MSVGTKTDSTEGRSGRRWQSCAIVGSTSSGGTARAGSSRMSGVVVAVESGSPAARIGIDPDEMLLMLERLHIKTPLQIYRILRSHGSGDAQRVEVMRQDASDSVILHGELVIGRPAEGRHLTGKQNLRFHTILAH